MKKRIFTLSLLTLVAGAIVDADAAKAQGARFQFEPNKWQIREPQKSGRYLNQAPQTNVGHGMVPKASTFLGVDPSILKPVPKPQPVQPMVATNVRPSASWGQPQAKIMPKSLAATPFNPGFGNPMQNSPVVAQQPPAVAPQQQLAQPSNSRSLSGRMVPKRSGNSHSKNAVAGRLMKPKQPTGLAAQPKVASYGNNFFTPGSTKPTSSGYSSKSDVYGQILNHH